jgi:hypothetical protein
VKRVSARAGPHGGIPGHRRDDRALVVVSAGGASGSSGLYQDNPLITATFRGQDWLTVLVAIPPLGAGLVLATG